MEELVRLVPLTMLKQPTKKDLIKIPSAGPPSVSLFKKLCPFLGCAKTFKVRIDSVRIRHSYMKAHLDQHMKGLIPVKNGSTSQFTKKELEEEQTYECFIDDDENEEENESDGDTDTKSEELLEESEYSRVTRKMSQLDAAVPLSMRKPRGLKDLQKFYSPNEEPGVSHYAKLCPVIGCLRKFKMKVDATRIRYDYFKTHLDQHIAETTRKNPPRTITLPKKHSEDQILFYVPSKNPPTGIKIERVDSFHQSSSVTSGSTSFRIKDEPMETNSTVREGKSDDNLKGIFAK